MVRIFFGPVAMSLLQSAIVTPSSLPKTGQQRKYSCSSSLEELNPVAGNRLLDNGRPSAKK
jgi:hypothetical protein